MFGGVEGYHFAKELLPNSNRESAKEPLGASTYKTRRPITGDQFYRRPVQMKGQKHRLFAAALV